jgi:ribonuclease G
MKKILINEEPWQTRVAIIQDEKLQNIYFWSHAGNVIEKSFYQSLVTKVLPGIQTAFVDIGQEKAGFLHISEIDRELAINRMSKSFAGLESGEKKERAPRHAPDIAKILKEGELLLVQVSKEPVNEKGAKLTTCFTLPGRFIVLMPSIPRIGISKKIEDRDERTRLKELVGSHLPEGMGAIIRTCSENRADQEIGQDIKFLVRTWNTILEKQKTAQVGEQIHEDIDLSLQMVRDHLDNDVEEVLVDNINLQKKLTQFVKDIAPEFLGKIKIYTGKTPLFEKYDIENQIKESLKSKVDLRSGGSIVIEATEAMTVVDVNTGRFVGRSNMEDTILKTNLEAAEEVTRQLKIRNIGGLIVIDFIDMASGANRQKLFRFFEKNLKEQDKFQSVLLKISEFGLVQMTRKRSGKTLIKELTDTCKTCIGTGVLPSVRAESYALLRHLKEELAQKKVRGDITIKLSPEVFEYISTTEYDTLFDFEKELDGKITLESEKSLPLGSFKIETH